MSARDEILGRIGQARAGAPVEPAAHEGTQALIPPGFVREAPDLVALFLAKLNAASASHAVLERLAELPSHLSNWLAEKGLSAELILAQEDFVGLDWQGAGLQPSLRSPDPLAPGTVVSRAFAGVAETGSVALVTRSASRPRHNLLADTHVVVLDRAQVRASIEDIWQEARRGGLPRSLAFITGPSRTGDIEMAIELGAHGAINLHVVLIDRNSAIA